MCRMIPSPDWYIGVDGINLCVDSSWVDQITLDVRKHLFLVLRLSTDAMVAREAFIAVSTPHPLGHTFKDT